MGGIDLSDEAEVFFLLKEFEFGRVLQMFVKAHRFVCMCEKIVDYVQARVVSQ